MNANKTTRERRLHFAAQLVVVLRDGSRARLRVVFPEMAVAGVECFCR